jgi:hypothetical protein
MLARLVSVAACALALTVAGATSAQAASQTFVDGPGDVWVGRTQATNHDHGDILRTTFTHTRGQVIVRTAFAELNRDGQILVFTRLRTNTGNVRDLSLTASARAAGRWRGQALLTTTRGVPVECPRRVTHTIDYATNVAVVRVPRICLDNPRTVQARFGVATWNRIRRVFTDNPINHGSTENLPAYTAPVRVG